MYAFTSYAANFGAKVKLYGFAINVAADRGRRMKKCL